MKKWESVYFQSGEVRLHAARHPGSGDRPIVVVPGITTPAGAFAVTADRLAEIGSDVYVLDMRGRGLSQRVPYGSHRSGDYADDVLALIGELGLDQPLLVGHSLGARVVAAARVRFPGASSGVVAIDPPMSGPGRRPYPMALDRFLSGLHGARAGHGTEQARADYPTWTDDEVRLRGEWLASCDETAVVDSYAWFHLEAFEPVWQEVEPPALLLYGDRSPVVTAADAALLQQVNPRADVVAVADSGHMVPWDNLDQTVTEIAGFLSRLGASS
jgi:N-formylmaleamate deformylase